MNENKDKIINTKPLTPRPVQTLPAPSDTVRQSNMSIVNVALGIFYFVVISAVFTICGCAFWRSTNFAADLTKDKAQPKYSVLSQADLDVYEKPNYVSNTNHIINGNKKSTGQLNDFDDDNL